MSNLNKKPSCSSVNGTDVVKQQLIANDVGLHVSGVQAKRRMMRFLTL